ncbi:DUF721 domain-containing protein [Nitrosovibrio tenuis]|uniref:DUF721 domain-containing protein n=1 Tax=Nitrosovibrio tenuis TaxID=1233 RepID=A0A1H7G0N0_9PROT|nr:DUF721 domain-containing protein [Nitrosovibrio tenuis]SEK31903.1 Protein of unknown function [Nitrosovibrio tenuis]
MTVHKINFYLGVLSQTADHQRLFSYMSALTLMQQVFMEIAPPQLAQHCALGGFSQRKLTICAPNGAIAAKLRQTMPSLLLKFQAKGYEVTAIRVAVQANSAYVKGSPAARPQIDQGGVESLHRLAADLPQSPLKEAVESLLKKACSDRRAG